MLFIVFFHFTAVAVFDRILQNSNNQTNKMDPDVRRIPDETPIYDMAPDENEA